MLVVSVVFSFSFRFRRFMVGDVGYLPQLIARQPGLYGSTLVGYFVSLETFNGQFLYI